MKLRINESKINRIPYNLVSILVILRDFVDTDNAYINNEHKLLVDIADNLYNTDISPDEMLPKYQKVYNKYGKDYFDTVLDDIQALDTQVNSRNVNDLIDEYNDKADNF